MLSKIIYLQHFNDYFKYKTLSLISITFNCVTDGLATLTNLQEFEYDK